MRVKLKTGLSLVQNRGVWDNPALGTTSPDVSQHLIPVRAHHIMNSACYRGQTLTIKNLKNNVDDV